MFSKNLESQSRFGGYDAEKGEEIREVFYKLPEIENYYGTSKEFNENQRRIIEEIIEVIDIVISRYKIFRSEVKKKLFI